MKCHILSLDADMGGVATVVRLADEALVAKALEADRDRHDADVRASDGCRGDFNAPFML